MVQNTGDTRYLLEVFEDIEIDLTEHWYNIYQEWSKIIGGSRSDLSLLKIKRMLALKHKFDYQSSLFRMVQTLPIPELVEMFNEEGFKIDLDNYQESIAIANGKLQKRKAQIELEEQNETKEEAGDFDNVIAILSKFQGYRFEEKEMTVRMFANIYKNYKEDGKRRENNKG